MPEKTVFSLELSVLEKFIFLWERVKEAADVTNITLFQERRNEFRDFIKLYPSLKSTQYNEIKEIYRQRKINDILEN